MIPLGVVASSKKTIPLIDTFIWTAGNNYSPRNGGSVDYSQEILIDDISTYSVNLAESFGGYAFACVKNNTTAETVASTVYDEATYSENGTPIGGGQGQSPIIETIYSGTLVGMIDDAPGEFVGLISDLNVDSGGWGAGLSGPMPGYVSPGSYMSNGGPGMPSGIIFAGMGGDGISNPFYSTVQIGPQYVCAGGIGNFQGSYFFSFGNSGSTAGVSPNFPNGFLVDCLYLESGTNTSNPNDGSGATELNTAQIGTNAGTGGAVIRSTVELQFSGSVSTATYDGYYYYYCIANRTFQIA